MQNRSVFVALVKATVQAWWDDNATQLAAALSFYSFFAIAPMLLIAVTVAGFLYDSTLARTALLRQMGGLIGADGAALLGSIMENMRPKQGNVVASVIGLGTILFAATGVFAALQNSLNRIWRAEAKPISGLWGLIRTRFLSFALVLGIGFLLLVSLVVNTLLAAFDGWLRQLLPGYEFWLHLLNLLLAFGVTTILFAMIFKVLPDVHVRWRNVALGAVVTAVLFTIGKSLIGLYLGNSAFGSTYGAAGSLAILLLWVYYSAQILFLGAEFTRAYTLWSEPTLFPAEGSTPGAAAPPGQV
ncbi:MAG TPA: YihY/virulence factor BrkB family protein [Caldilineaceae bacterium]|nr:YihY/virulence factor BrkB family protein [Caldilineaceae bacterium]